MGKVTKLREIMFEFIIEGWFSQITNNGNGLDVYKILINVLIQTLLESPGTSINYCKLSKCQELNIYGKIRKTNLLKEKTKMTVLNHQKRVEIVLSILSNDSNLEEMSNHYGVSTEKLEDWKAVAIDAIYQSMETDSSWINKLISEHTLWDESKFNSVHFPFIIEHEYLRIYQLLKENQPYGAFLQIKDVYEILLKLPILLVANKWFSDRKNNSLSREKTSAIFLLVETVLNLGDWVTIGNKIKTILKEEQEKTEFETYIFQLLTGILKTYHTNNIVNWRNTKIGHGALGFIDNPAFHENLEKHIRIIHKYLGNERIRDAYRNIKLTKRKEQWKVSAGRESFQLIPYFLNKGGKIYIFDSYYSRKQKSAFLDYINGDKVELLNDEIKALSKLLSKQKDYEPLFHQQDGKNETSDFYLRHQVDSQIRKILAEDYFEPTYLTNWLQSSVNENPKGIFVLQMKQGMGKTTFVKGLDPLDLGRQTIPNTTIRAYYFNSFYSQQMVNFLHGLTDSLRTVVIEKEILANKLKFNTEKYTDSKKNFIDMLGYYQQQQEKTTEKEKLIIILDGLDELHKVSADKIFQLLPSKDELPENVFILLTARLSTEEGAHKEFIATYTQQDYFNDVMTVEPNRVENKELLKKYLQKATTDSDQIDRILNEDHRFLYIKPYYDLLSLGVKDIKQRDIVEIYINQLRLMYSDKFFNDFELFIALFAMNDEGLLIDEIHDLLFEDSPRAYLVGYFFDFRSWLTSEHTPQGKAYQIVNKEVQMRLAEIPTIRRRIQQIMTKWKAIRDQKLNNGVDLTPVQSYVFSHFDRLAHLFLEDEVSFSSGRWMELERVAHQLRLQAGSRRELYRALGLYQFLSEQLPEESSYYHYFIAETRFLLKEDKDKIESINYFNKIFEKLNMTTIKEKLSDKRHTFLKTLNLQYSILKTSHQFLNELNSNEQVYKEIYNEATKEQKKHYDLLIRKEEVPSAQMIRRIAYDESLFSHYFYMNSLILRLYRDKNFSKVCELGQELYRHMSFAPNKNSLLLASAKFDLLTVLSNGMFMLYHETLEQEAELTMKDFGFGNIPGRRTGENSKKLYYQFFDIFMEAAELLPVLDKENLSDPEFFINLLRLMMQSVNELKFSTSHLILMKNTSKEILKQYEYGQIDNSGSLAVSLSNLNQYIQEIASEEKDALSFESLQTFIFERFEEKIGTVDEGLEFYNKLTDERDQRLLLYHLILAKQRKFEAHKEVLNEEWLNFAKSQIKTLNFPPVEKDKEAGIYFHLGLWTSYVMNMDYYPPDKRIRFQNQTYSFYFASRDTYQQYFKAIHNGASFSSVAICDHMLATTCRRLGWINPKEIQMKEKTRIEAINKSEELQTYLRKKYPAFFDKNDNLRLNDFVII